MNIKIEHMPERWVVIWADNDGIRNKEFFSSKEKAKEFKEKIVAAAGPDIDREKKLTDN